MLKSDIYVSFWGSADDLGQWRKIIGDIVHISSFGHDHCFHQPHLHRPDILAILFKAECNLVQWVVVQFNCTCSKATALMVADAFKAHNLCK